MSTTATTTITTITSKLENDCDYNYGDLLNGLPCPTPYPTSVPRPPTYTFIDSRGGLREQLVFNGDNGLHIDKNKNENFFDTEYDLFNGPLCPPPTPAPTIIFTRINTRLPVINVLKGVFGIGLSGNNIDNEINNGLDSGMFIFIFKNFFSL